MIAARIVFMAMMLALLGGATYLSLAGVGGESDDAARSIREGSVRGPGYSGRIK